MESDVLKKIFIKILNRDTNVLLRASTLTLRNVMSTVFNKSILMIQFNKLIFVTL